MPEYAKDHAKLESLQRLQNGRRRDEEQRCRGDGLVSYGLVLSPCEESAECGDQKFAAPRDSCTEHGDRCKELVRRIAKICLTFAAVLMMKR
jgi:hypothetical protein